ncbi:MAG: metallophosphoesterase family protein [Gemmatimonadota bacterium]
MITIFHASDLHFGKPYRPEVGEALLEVVDQVIPDAVVVSGDLTQRAREEEFEEARAYLDRMAWAAPVVVTPGNHDVPLYRVVERIFQPYRYYKKHISEELDTVTRVEGAVFVSLNSSAPRRAIVNGRIDDHQMAFAARAFEESDPGETKILVAHHHLAGAPDYEDDTTLPNARQILDQFNRMGVELILGGHLHRAYIGNSLDVYPGRDREHGIVIVQSGTSTSHRGRAREEARNSFNVIRIAEDHLEITHYMYFDEIHAFAPFSMHAYPRREDRFFPRDPVRGGLLLNPGELTEASGDAGPAREPGKVEE